MATVMSAELSSRTLQAAPVGARPEPASVPPSMSQPNRSARPGPLDIGVFAALAMALAALAMWALFQSWIILGERDALVQAAAGQQQQIDASSKVRQQLDAVASGMQKLADTGNTNAKLVVEELRRRGVTINVNGPAAAGK